MRFIPIQSPRHGPYFTIAWARYSEQLGEYRHTDGLNRDVAW
jgi:hypothetical protein